MHDRKQFLQENTQRIIQLTASVMSFNCQKMNATNFNDCRVTERETERKGEEERESDIGDMMSKCQSERQ